MGGFRSPLPSADLSLPLPSADLSLPTPTLGPSGCGCAVRGGVPSSASPALTMATAACLGGRGYGGIKFKEGGDEARWMPYYVLLPCPSRERSSAFYPGLVTLSAPHTCISLPEPGRGCGPRPRVCTCVKKCGVCLCMRNRGVMHPRTWAVIGMGAGTTHDVI